MLHLASSQEDVHQQGKKQQWESRLHGHHSNHQNKNLKEISHEQLIIYTACMFFTTQEVTRSEIDSGMFFNLDEDVADKISRLSKLVFLDLCKPYVIQSDAALFTLMPLKNSIRK